MKTTNNAARGIYPIITSLFCLTLLVISLAWFFSNRLPAAGSHNLGSISYNMDVSISAYKSDKTTEYECVNGLWNVSDIKLGEKYYLELTLKNNDTKKIKTAVSFMAPDNDTTGSEIPFISGNYYYYLATQLRITDVALGGGNLISKQGLWKYLLPTSGSYDENGLPAFAEVSSPQTVSDVRLADLSVEPGNTAVLLIEVTYVNSSVNQNAFKLFGSRSDETCIRRVACSYSAE